MALTRIHPTPRWHNWPSPSYRVPLHPWRRGEGREYSTNEVQSCVRTFGPRYIVVHCHAHSGRTGPVLTALQASDLEGRWQALAQVAKDAQILMPKSDGKTERAAARIQKNFRKPRAQREGSIKVAEIALLGGTWRNEIAAAASDAFCIIVPGHSCPDPTTCSGPVSVPVIHRHTSCQHLIAACHHNLGCVNIVPYSQPLPPSVAVSSCTGMSAFLRCLVTFGTTHGSGKSVLWL